MNSKIYLNNLENLGYTCLHMRRTSTENGGYIDHYLIQKHKFNLSVLIDNYPGDKGFDIYPQMKGNDINSDFDCFNCLVGSRFDSLSIVNFAYFTANFRSDFILQCWKDRPHLISHLEVKFLQFAEESGVITAGGFMRFFFELDRDNQIKLATWINENYKGVSR